MVLADGLGCRTQIEQVDSAGGLGVSRGQLLAEALHVREQYGSASLENVRTMRPKTSRRASYLPFVSALLAGIAGVGAASSHSGAVTPREPPRKPFGFGRRRQQHRATAFLAVF